MSVGRDEIVERARALCDLGADPADPEARAAYLDLIAPGADASVAASLATVSGCALVVRGLWRSFISHPLLDGPYRVGHAVRDLVAIAQAARGATLELTRVPEPGDVVIVGGGVNGGGVEHVFTVLTISEDEASSGWVIEGVDGGQRDEGGHQVIRARTHVISGGRDKVEDATDPGGGSARRVRWVLDAAAVIEKFGAEG